MDSFPLRNVSFFINPRISYLKGTGFAYWSKLTGFLNWGRLMSLSLSMPRNEE